MSSSLGPLQVDLQGQLAAFSQLLPEKTGQAVKTSAADVGQRILLRQTDESKPFSLDNLQIIVKPQNQISKWWCLLVFPVFYFIGKAIQEHLEDKKTEENINLLRGKIDELIGLISKKVINLSEEQEKRVDEVIKYINSNIVVHFGRDSNLNCVSKLERLAQENIQRLNQERSFADLQSSVVKILEKLPAYEGSEPDSLKEIYEACKECVLEELNSAEFGIDDEYIESVHSMCLKIEKEKNPNLTLLLSGWLTNRAKDYGKTGGLTEGDMREVVGKIQAHQKAVGQKPEQAELQPVALSQAVSARATFEPGKDGAPPLLSASLHTTLDESQPELVDYEALMGSRTIINAEKLSTPVFVRAVPVEVGSAEKAKRPTLSNTIAHNIGDNNQNGYRKLTKHNVIEVLNIIKNEIFISQFYKDAVLQTLKSKIFGSEESGGLGLSKDSQASKILDEIENKMKNTR